MKTRRYTITTGQYDSYKIVAQIEGAAKPALSTLYKEFELIAFRGEPLQKDNTAEAIRANINRTYHAHNRLHMQGYKGDNLAELFIDWLVKEHGFKTTVKDEFYVPS